MLRQGKHYSLSRSVRRQLNASKAVSVLICCASARMKGKAKGPKKAADMLQIACAYAVPRIVHCQAHQQESADQA